MSDRNRLDKLHFRITDARILLVVDLYNIIDELG